MRLRISGVLWLAALGPARQAQACCTSDLDCLVGLNEAQEEYNNQFDKSLQCDQGCPGLINCNMFGICEMCRGCFETCEGAVKYMEVTQAPPEFVTFCSGVGISDLSDCDDGDNDPTYGEGSGSGSASSGGAGSGSGSGSGQGSASGDVTAAYGSGAGSGSASSGGAGSGSGSGSGQGSASGDVTAGYASGAGSGSGSSSSMSGSASGSGDASRIAEIDGCDCGSAELDPTFAAYFCENDKSMYCDLECVDDADPADNLFSSMGGLWCQPRGWSGCRMCKFDCSTWEGDGCVPCPAGVKTWC